MIHLFILFLMLTIQPIDAKTIQQDLICLLSPNAYAKNQTERLKESCNALAKSHSVAIERLTTPPKKRKIQLHHAINQHALLVTTNDVEDELKTAMPAHPNAQILVINGSGKTPSTNPIRSGLGISCGILGHVAADLAPKNIMIIDHDQSSHTTCVRSFKNAAYHDLPKLTIQSHSLPHQLKQPDCIALAKILETTQPDVVFSIAYPDEVAPLIKNMPTKWIGFQSDQSALAPDQWISAPIEQYTDLIAQALNQFRHHNLKDQKLTTSIKTASAGITPFGSAVPYETRNRAMAMARAAIADGFHPIDSAHSTSFDQKT